MPFSAVNSEIYSNSSDSSNFDVASSLAFLLGSLNTCKTTNDPANKPMPTTEQTVIKFCDNI